jgi:adenosylcobinamide-GDP ribazoletransferase
MNRFKLALTFLTILPARLSTAPQPGDLGRSAFWFPWVGLLLGVMLVAANILFNSIFPPLLSSALVISLWAILTGGLHLDGLADCCDGLLATVSPERRLEILKDPRLGSFGGIGLGLHLLLKTAAIASLAAVPLLFIPPHFSLSISAAPLLLAPTAARWLILPVARGPMARPGGLGAEFSQSLNPGSLLLSSILPLTMAVLSGLRGFLAVFLAALVTLVVVKLAMRRLGGLTGDVLGLVVELSELTILLVFSIK